VTIRTVAAIAGVVVSLTLILAGVAWILWGASAAFVVVGFVTAIAGLSKALIELTSRLGQVLAKATAEERVKVQGPRGGWAWVTVPAGLVIGAGLGYLVLPGAVQWALRPVVSIGVSRRVLVRQPVTLHWRNVPDGQRIWLLVYAKKDEVSFVQPCHTEGQSSGSLNCEVEVGGSDDGDQEFEVRAVLANPDGGRKLIGLPEPGYLRTYPSGVSLVDSVPVLRKP
jgi:hypothetical protein